MAAIEGEQTIHEAVLQMLDITVAHDRATDNADTALTKKALIKLLQRVARATQPRDTTRTTVEPVGKTPWDWINSKNVAFAKACAHEGIASAMMNLLRGAEVWADDHGTTLEYVDVSRTLWTADGRLIVEFKKGNDA